MIILMSHVRAGIYSSRIHSHSKTGLMAILPLNINRKALLFAIALCCFVLHTGLIVHHTYYTASFKNSRIVSPPVSMSFEKIQFRFPESWHSYLDLNRWDSAHYADILKKGYRSESGSEPPYSIMWYPGYPLLAKPIYWLTGWTPTFIFSLLSALLTLCFWILFWSKPMVSEVGVKTLVVGSALIMCWPGAFYWFAGMTEPLVSLILVALIVLWLSNRFNAIVVLLAYATAVKQVFTAVVLALFSLEYLRHKPALPKLLLKALLAFSGFLGFGLFTLYTFGNFFLSSDTCFEIFEKEISIIGMFNLSHYARHILSLGGATFCFSIVFLLVVFIQLTEYWPDRYALKSFFTPTSKSIPFKLVLWWTALACTSFYGIGEAYGEPPFMSMFRFQTTNIPLFLLIACQTRHISWWKTLLLLLPLLWTGLFWQEKLTVKYWFWQWVA